MKGFGFRKSLDLFVKPRVKSYMIARNSIMFTAKPETFYFNSCEIPQRHQQTDCFHCREQNHTNKR